MSDLSMLKAQDVLTAQEVGPCRPDQPCPEQQAREELGHEALEMVAGGGPRSAIIGMLGGTPNRVQNGEVVQNAAESLPSPKKTFGERFGEFANTEFGKSSMAGLMGIGTAVSSYESVHAIQKGKHSA